jgi:hypothetical protein
MGDWIRQGITAPSMPLELLPRESDDPATRADEQITPQTPAGNDSGGRPHRHESMNDLIRRGVRERE